MAGARRVRQVSNDGKTVEIYESIKMAADQNGISENKVSYWLDRGYTPHGFFYAIDPKNNGVTIEVDGKWYPSLGAAAKSEGFCRTNFTPKIRKGLKKFTICGKLCKITDAYIP